MTFNDNDDSVAEAHITRAGGRVTRARVAVYRLLLTSSEAFSHTDVAAQLMRSGIDRVTVYRVLEWLVEHDLVHKIAGEDRVWRFSAHTNAQKEHAHFHCNRCGRVFCLEQESQPPRPRLPRGFRFNHIEMTVLGTCAQCHGAL